MPISINTTNKSTSSRLPYLITLPIMRTAYLKQGNSRASSATTSLRKTSSKTIPGGVFPDSGIPPSIMTHPRISQCPLTFRILLTMSLRNNNSELISTSLPRRSKIPINLYNQSYHKIYKIIDHKAGAESTIKLLLIIEAFPTLEWTKAGTTPMIIPSILPRPFPGLPV